MNSQLLEYARNQQLLRSLITTNRQGHPDPNELKDVTVLSYQHAKNSEPGTPQHKFFKAVHQKMVRLSGGVLNKPEDWEVSELEVEVLEGMCQTVVTVLVQHLKGTSEIGGGGFSRVHRGVWKGESVAVKVMLAGGSEKVRLESNSIHGISALVFINSQSFRKEVATWRTLNHPRIHRFFLACLTSESPFLVSALCHNGNVIEYLEKTANPNRLGMVSSFPRYILRLLHLTMTSCYWFRCAISLPDWLTSTVKT